MVTSIAVASLLATAAPAATSAAQPRQTATAIPAGLILVGSKTSLLGTHAWYRQTARGLPVVDGYYAVHTDHSGRVTSADGRHTVPAGLNITPKVSADTAQAVAVTAQQSTAQKTSLPSGQSAQRSPKQRSSIPAPTADATRQATLAIQGGQGARLVWQVRSSAATGAVTATVDAATGVVLTLRSGVKNARSPQALSGEAGPTGSGNVFNPNPSVTLRTQKLTDQGDADQAVFTPAYRNVTLTRLGNGGVLRGDWARIMNPKVATSPTNSFLYSRKDNRFEQVMAYHQVTVAQQYLQQLGFTDVNNEPQQIFTNTIPDDNSFYNPATDQITFGYGGVDDAEDAEVIWHELGHAIQDDQVPGFGRKGQSAAIGEGFGDYLAVTLSIPSSSGYDLPCVADWDSTSYTAAPHCLRRTDSNKTTNDLTGDVHEDGEIWSRALYDIHRKLGRSKADTTIIESQFSYLPDTTFAAAARQVVATAQKLYGSAAAKVCREAFAARRIPS